MVQNITRIKKVNGEIVSDDAVFAVLPLFHSFAQNMCIWMPMVFGVTVILVAKIERRYILEGLRHKPTIFLGVPALYGLLCLLKNAPIDLVKFFVSGGDALPDKIRAAFKLIYRRRILNGYGMTEATPVISCESEDVVLPTSTVGCPIMHLEYSIRDDYGNPMPSDRIGILWVKGDNVMLGYYNEPEKTAEILQDGWLCTGDLARIDDAGRIVICGREKDLIISKGFNIYPQEIENILLTHPLVIRAAVVGKLADDVGEVPVALVEVREKKEGLDRELRDLCVRQLAPYKVPRAYHLLGMDELPQTATKKINKKKIRADINATE